MNARTQRTQWRVVKRATQIGLSRVFITNDKGATFEQASSGSGRLTVPVPQSSADAADTLVRACNAHDALVAALHALLDDVSDLSDEARAKFGGKSDRSVMLARAALAQLKP